MLINKIFRPFFFIFFSSCSLVNIAQQPVNIELQTDLIVDNFISLKNANDDFFIIKTAKKIDSIFENVLSNEASFDYSLQKLTNYCSVLNSDDKNFRIITWNIFLSDGSFYYYGYVQYLWSKDKIFNFEKLTDNSDKINLPRTANLSADNWFGCLYYDIVTVKNKKQYYYTLLGWDGNNLLSNKKIIEVISVKNNKVKFGYNFNFDGKNYNRLIFEYNKQANMVVKWEKENKRIILDHLSPIAPKYNEIYQFYGPDLSHDALILKRNNWLFVPNIVVLNKK